MALHGVQAAPPEDLAEMMAWNVGSVVLRLPRAAIHSMDICRIN